ncbi:MAG: DNA translocase FtsK [Alphaproteobacteria bacterium]
MSCDRVIRSKRILHLKGVQSTLSIYTNFLPPALSDFLRRWAQKSLATAFVLGSFCLLISLLSYHPADPSFNVASGQAASNLWGHFGASVADLFFQFFGLPSFLVAFVLAAWAWRYFIHCPLQKLKKRSFFLLVCLLSLGFFIALISPENQRLVFPLWATRVSLGGAFGTLLSTLFTTNTSPFAYLLLLKASSFLISGASFVYVVGLKPEEWQRLAGFIISGVQSFVRGIQNLMSWILRYTTSPSALRVKVKKPVSKRSASPKHKVVSAQTVFKERVPPQKKQTAPLTQKRTAPQPKPSTVTPFPSPLSDSYDPETVSPLMNMPSPLDNDATEDTTTDAGHYDDEYSFPPVSYLKRGKTTKTQVSEAKLSKQARLLEEVLLNFGVKGEIQGVHPGPIITLYEFDPEPGVKSSKVIGLSDDIARSMSATSVRVSVIPGQRALGIEIPNDVRETVFLRDIMDSDTFTQNDKTLPLILGKDIGGETVIAELAKMPHLLIAGTTGSGKSVAVNTMILTLLYQLSPDQCRLIMIDPKMLELSVYQDIPHLLTPVVTDPKKAVFALKWAVREMENRYRAMSELGVRNIDGYNDKMLEILESGKIPTKKIKAGYDPETAEPLFEEQPIDTNPLPYIVIFVDEMADLMLVAGKEIEANIQRLAQMARAAGIHLIMATQRPSVDVITGTIKANFPTRISFQVTSKIDSRTILGEQGAEQLLGRGDMLYMAPGERTTRVHAPLVMDGEIEKIVTFLKKQGTPTYIEDVTKDNEAATAVLEGGENDLYNQAVSIIKRERKASTSFIQRKLQIGYNRAANLIEQLEKEGVISEATHAGKRDVLIPE